MGALFGVGIVGAAVSKVANPSVDRSDLASIASGGPDTSPEPIYTREQVAQHDQRDDIWVTFQGSVYNVTDFVAMHPGGEKILLAAGKSLEPYWSMYRVHLTDDTKELLDQYKIGTLPDHERLTEPDMTDPFASDPDRTQLHLVVNTDKPFNAETPLDVLADMGEVTPRSSFFVRNHLPVPIIDPDLYELVVYGPGLTTRSITLDELKKFPKHTVRSTVQCAGNRRASMGEVQPVRGLQWGQGAISTATWSGARLVDVLSECGYTESSADKFSSVRHVHFEGMDRDAVQNYAASVPIEKACDPRSDVLLAYEMNGETLPIDNGFPVRAIVPGVVGARNVKWVSAVHLESTESDSHWQQLDYKGFSPSSDWEHINYDASYAIQELPIQSAVCSPLPNDEFAPGSTVPMKGYAYSGGGREIIRVDVSVDGGKTWSVADLDPSDQSEGKHWAMRRWSANVPLPLSTADSSTELVCKAVDRAYNVQPESFPPIFNIRGVLCTAWHRVPIKLITESLPLSDPNPPVIPVPAPSKEQQANTESA